MDDRKRWVRFGWKLTEKGIHKKAGERNVGVMLSRFHEAKYLYWIGSRGGGKPEFSEAKYESADEAKLAIYDLLFAPPR